MPADDQPTRRATLAQVAERAGVSPMTASYAFNRPGRVSAASRAKVRAAADELGYAGPDPRARSLRRGSSRTLGVVLGEHLPYAFEDPQAAVFLAGVAEVCAGVGHGMTILPLTGAEDDVARIRDAAVDGFVVWTTTDDDPVLEAISSTRLPAVVHSGPSVEGMALVGIDNAAAAREVGLLAFAGSRRPAVLSFPLDKRREAGTRTGLDVGSVLFPVTRERLDGYRSAAADLGFAWDEVQVVVCSRNDTREAERLALDWLGGDDRPDAVAAMGDEVAAGVLRAAATLGARVPEDVAVTGWDDSARAARLDLTTVAQSMRDQGSRCARAALGLDVGDERDGWHVVRRGSTRR